MSSATALRTNRKPRRRISCCLGVSSMCMESIRFTGSRIVRLRVKPLLVVPEQREQTPADGDRHSRKSNGLNQHPATVRHAGGVSGALRVASLREPEVTPSPPDARLMPKRQEELRSPFYHRLQKSQHPQRIPRDGISCRNGPPRRCASQRHFTEILRQSHTLPSRHFRRASNRRSL